MHTGRMSSLDEVLDAYADVPFKNIADKLPNGEDYNFQFTEQQRKALIAFISNSLTDPRVKNERYPFDRPTLRSENTNSITKFTFTASVTLNEMNQPNIHWQIKSADNTTGIDVEIIRNHGRHFWTTSSPFIDELTESNTPYSYQVNLRNPQLQTINSQTVEIKTSKNTTDTIYYLITQFFMIITSLLALVAVGFAMYKLSTRK